MAIKMLSKLCVTKLLLRCHQLKPRHLCSLNFLKKKTVNYVSFGSQSDGFHTTTKVLFVFFVFYYNFLYVTEGMRYWVKFLSFLRNVFLINCTHGFKTIHQRFLKHVKYSIPFSPPQNWNYCSSSNLLLLSQGRWVNRVWKFSTN